MDDNLSDKVSCDCITHYIVVEDGSVILLGKEQYDAAIKDLNVAEYIDEWYYCPLCGRKLDVMFN